MNITGSEKFEKFCKKYNDAQPAVEKWVTEPIQIMMLLM